MLLHCLDLSWEIHRPFLQKSDTLYDLVEKAGDPVPSKDLKNKASEKIDNYIAKNDCYSTEYQVSSSDGTVMS